MKPVAAFDRVSKRYRLGAERSNWRSLVPGPFGEIGDGEDFAALRDVSFEIGDGESLGIIGANGAGKSTVLKLLAGIIEPSSGTVEVRGRVAPVIELGVGFDEDLTGAENLRHGAAVLGISAGDLQVRYDDIVDFSGLGPFMDTPLKRYSTGMRARLGFSLVTSFEAEILLLDEVLSVGDWEFQRRSIERIRSMHEAGSALVAVSHSNWMLTQVCERMLLLEHGEVVIEGDPIAVIGRYLGDDTIGVGDPIPEDQIVAPVYAVSEDDPPVSIDDLELLPSEIDPGDRLRFRFRLTVQRPVSGMVVMSIHTFGRAIFAEPEEGPSHLLGEPGVWEVEGEVRSVPIAPGRYELTVAAVEEHLEDDHHQAYVQAYARATRPLAIRGDLTSRPGLAFDVSWDVGVGS